MSWPYREAWHTCWVMRCEWQLYGPDPSRSAPISLVLPFSLVFQHGSQSKRMWSRATTGLYLWVCAMSKKYMGTDYVRVQPVQAKAVSIFSIRNYLMLPAKWKPVLIWEPAVPSMLLSFLFLHSPFMTPLYSAPVRWVQVFLDSFSSLYLWVVCIYFDFCCKALLR